MRGEGGGGGGGREREAAPLRREGGRGRNKGEGGKEAGFVCGSEAELFGAGIQTLSKDLKKVGFMPHLTLNTKI